MDRLIALIDHLLPLARRWAPSADVRDLVLDVAVGTLYDNQGIANSQELFLNADRRLSSAIRQVKRLRKRLQPLDNRAEPVDPRTTLDLEGAEARAQIAAIAHVLNQLTPREARLLRARSEGRDWHEISGELGEPQGRLRQSYSRLLKRLRRRLL